MTIDLPFFATVALAGVASLFGKLLVSKSGFLRKLHIPEPFLGGLAFAIIILLFRISGTRINVPTAGEPVDVLVALLTANMGLHITRKVLSQGAKLFVLFLTAGILLFFLQLLIVLPLAQTQPFPMQSALVGGPLSFVGAPFNLNPPSQTAPVKELFLTGFPHLKATAQGVMMIGVICSILFSGLVGRRLLGKVDEKHPLKSSSESNSSISLSHFSNQTSNLLVLILSIIAVAYFVQHYLLSAFPGLKKDHLPVIVICFLFGAGIRLLFSYRYKKDVFPERALTVLLIGPTMNLVLTYAIMSVPLYQLVHVSGYLLIAGLLSVATSFVVSLLAFRVFCRFTNDYYAAVICTAFFSITTGWGPTGMSFLRDFIDVEGRVEPMPAIMPLNAFYIFPWMVIIFTQILL